MRLSVYFLLFSFFVASSYSEENDIKKSQCQGVQRQDFSYDGLKCILVIPASPAKGSPCVWRARFFGHQPQADIELLKKGFHIAYCDVAGLFGNEVAVDRWDIPVQQQWSTCSHLTY